MVCLCWADIVALCGFGCGVSICAVGVPFGACGRFCEALCEVVRLVWLCLPSRLGFVALNFGLWRAFALSVGLVLGSRGEVPL